MNNEIIEEISKNLGIRVKQVETVLKLLEDGNTIPFIARYRKELTGSLDEDTLRKIEEVYQYQISLLDRKNEVIRLIDEKGLLTDELKEEIVKAQKLVEVEDLYRPFKEKKKTKASIAIDLGLKPLAEIIMSFNFSGNLDDLVKPYLNEKVPSVLEALNGARDIIAEEISDNFNFRKWMRRYLYLNGIITSKVKKSHPDLDKVYEMYYRYQEKVNQIKPHRILALNRGEKEKVLQVSIDVNEKEIIDYLEKNIIRKDDYFFNDLIKEAIKDAYQRLVFPSVEREVRSELKDKGEVSAINNFSRNLERLLLTPPIKEKVVLGYDPAFRTGCKLAVLSKTGEVLEIAVIFPTPPDAKIEESKKIILDLIDKYQIDIIAIGNGTASRESEIFIADVLKEAKRKVEYIIVNEAGASVYSASLLAKEEFPNLTVEKRSAISIGRRLQDALSELVKIDPKSIGVGLYQHDLSQKNLDEALNFIVMKCVNNVGVNINTASFSILRYVSGLNKKVIDLILRERKKLGKFKNREEVRKIKGVTPKTFEQAIGFLRIIDGDNPLDKTNIHPENYSKTLKILTDLGFTLTDVGSKSLVLELEKVDFKVKSEELGIDSYTLGDIVESLKKPHRDPREKLDKPLLRSDIMTMEDLKIGDKLLGTVRNVVDFGAFIDIGLKNDGLAHISNLSKDYVKDPNDIIAVGDIVECYVIDILKDKKKVALSLIKNN